MTRSRWTALPVAALLAGTAVAQAPADLPVRVDRLEKEMKAVQRTVFPKGAPVEPEVVPGAPAPAAGDPASAPIADLGVRVDALEKSLARLTGEVEQQGNRLRLAEDKLAALDARTRAPEAGSLPGAVPDSGPAPSATTHAARPATPPRNAPAAAPADRKAAVAAIEIPVTADPAEDTYIYAYRLYSAKFYPEAEAALKGFVQRYPRHKRASYAQNLLGRAYLDDGKPALASVAFYDNYQKMPKGDRAPESLYWLGQALTRLKKLPDACKVYDELDSAYGATLSADLRAKAAKGRVDARCAG